MQAVPALQAVFARETGALETALWVPFLFAFAAVFIGLGHTVGDDIRRTRPLAVPTTPGADPADPPLLTDAPPPVRRPPPPAAEALRNSNLARSERPQHAAL